MVIGKFYKKLSKKTDYRIKESIENTVGNLLEFSTDAERPGMLLGRIQSGKTHAFIRIVALCFDNDYDIAIVLTKGTKALARQTVIRLKNDFKFFKNRDLVSIFDIMHLPDDLSEWERKKKIIFVAKKETNNLKRIINLLENTYPDLKTKRLLIIDDEADYASVGYQYDKDLNSIQIRKINKQINDVRDKVKSYSFLQVTATPYSLYLQPESDETESFSFKPVRPAFTTILPTYEGYIGGDFFFNESSNPESTAYNIYEEVPLEEIEILKESDRRSFKIENALISKRIYFFRKAIVNFIVGATLLRMMQNKNKTKIKNYSFIVHTEQSKASHSWQCDIVHVLKKGLQREANLNSQVLINLIDESIYDLNKSLKKGDNGITDFEKLKNQVIKAIKEDQVIIIKVNSDSQVENNLDEESGQLTLRGPLNIFIGGQILDRGLTIDNLIGFYYGRRPKRRQQDTVLQHLRIYGKRSPEDLAITRLYASRTTYDDLRKIFEFDTALRNAFESRKYKQNVVFIRKDPLNNIIPCSPNKIMISKITTLTPFKRLLPVGFQTDHKTNIKKDIKYIDDLIGKYLKLNKIEIPFLIKIEHAKQIIERIKNTLIFEKGYSWDYEAFVTAMEYYLKQNKNFQNNDRIWCLIRTNRNLSRKKTGGYSDAPDTPKTERVVAEKVATDLPILMLIRENGLVGRGWMDSPFWWPVLMMPKNTPVTIFADEIAEIKKDNEVTNPLEVVV